MTEDKILVDEFAAEMFSAMGFNRAHLPRRLVELYQAWKRRKDTVYPGRPTPGEFAMLVVLYDLESDREIEKTEPAEAAAGE